MSRSGENSGPRRDPIYQNNNFHNALKNSDPASMTKSELIEALAAMQSHLAFNDVELAVKNALEQMSQALVKCERIEIRGFGSFSLHYRPPRMGRNPKTSSAVALPDKHVSHFKPGGELREHASMRPTNTGTRLIRLDASRLNACAAGRRDAITTL
jgi:integration host factor subunit beta